jgi:hypothetical protein
MSIRMPAVVFVLFTLAAASPAAAQSTVVHLVTPLRGITLHEELVLRVVDTQGIAGEPARIRATFLDEDGDVVQTAFAQLPPGQAVTFRMPYSALGTRQPFPAVRMLFRLELPGTGEDNQVMLSYEFFDVLALRARCGESCAKSNPAEGGREFNCIGQVNDLSPPR